MITSFGQCVSEGIAIGKLKIFARKERVIDQRRVSDPEAEWARFEQAKEAVALSTMSLYEKALAQAGDEDAQILMMHAAILEDVGVMDPVREMILNEHLSSEWAVSQSFGTMAEIFKNMSEEYFSARSADVVDVMNDLLDALAESDNDTQYILTEPCILVSDDFLPSETLKFDREMILGIATTKGSQNSHTAILARNMGIPALVGCDLLDEQWDGHQAILDGTDSCLYIDPSEELLRVMEIQRSSDIEKKQRLAAYIGRKSVTPDGRMIHICANIGGPKDIPAVQANDADGIGLFRSEFLYLEGRKAPDEDTQFEAYKEVIAAMAPKQVVIRTCDIGADKVIDYMDLEKEANPALGLRAVRLSLTRPELFKTQLRAILRASAFGNVGIMFPMITSLWEIQACKDLLEICKKELEAEAKEIGNYEIGIMIETPAAALCADEFAKEVDFFSIGTNDLTQYACALDRQNSRMTDFLDTHHPAVLKLIRLTAKAAREEGIWAGICGELASDLSLTETFIEMGITELSVNPPMILPLREKVCTISM